MLAPGALDRYTPYYTGLSPVLDQRRPRFYLAIHDTETLTAVSPHSQGSWWLLIGRSDGELYDDVAIEQGAGNWTCRGIELVSHAFYRSIGEPFTAWQYRCVQDVCTWLLSTLPTGSLLIAIGHGEVQADRTDPVGFSWERAGFTPWLAAYDGHLFIGSPHVPPPPEDTMHLDDQQLKETILQALFDEAGIPYAPFFGIASAWVSEYRQGRYRGTPIGPEVEIAGTGIKWQRFAFGLVTYRTADNTFSWSA
jgi:hypothetical protein